MLPTDSLRGNFKLKATGSMSTAIASLADITAVQLDRYARLIYEKIGVTISPQKATLLSNRLRRRLRATGLGCYDEYFERIKKAPADNPEWQAFLQEVTTHETFLFRDQLQWDWLKGTFLPDLVRQAQAGKRAKTLRVWSAACSTGDEATTIACCIADVLKPIDQWKIEILGTDVGAGAVEHAKNAKFGVRAMRLVPDTSRRLFFEKAGTLGEYSPKPILKDLMQFRIHNLLEPLREPPFDLVFLKNVLIYFDLKSKQKVMQNIRRALKPGGRLVTGAAEGVADLMKDWQSQFGWLHVAPGKSNNS